MTSGEFKPTDKLVRRILPQLVIFSFIGVLYCISLVGLIPTPDQLNGILVEKFKIYGLPLIVFSAFLENLVGFNAYFPGAFTILTGMALTAGNPERAVLTYFAIYLPSFVANVLSYFFGAFCKNKKVDATSKKRNPLLWFFATYWHPQLASLTAFAAGSGGVSGPRQFFKGAIVASLFWSVFWAFIIYHFGLFADVAKHFVTIFLIYVVIWTVVDIYRWAKVSKTI